MLTRVVCAAFALLLSWAPSVSAVVLRLEVAGDSTFFTGLGDTVEVEVFLDSEGEALTGVELFLSLDPNLFSVVDADTAAGTQPALVDSLLGDVLADTLLAESDSLILVHYAEANLGGRLVVGRLMRFRLVALKWHSGTSRIALYQNSALFRTSAYTVLNTDGATTVWQDIPPLTFEDLPPVLAALPDLVVSEDDTLTVRLDTLAVDESDSLAWGITPASGDSLVRTVVRVEGDSILADLIPASDYDGSELLTVSVSDPAGGSAQVDITLQILPVNDPPVIDADSSMMIALAAGETSILVPFPPVSDVDDGVETLAWQVVDTEEVAGSVEVGGVRVQVPTDWASEAFLTLRIVDPKGRADEVILRVTRSPGSGLTGDFDNDGDVDFSDFLLFAGAFGKPNADPLFDLTGDGKVDFSDFLDFAAVFGT